MTEQTEGALRTLRLHGETVACMAVSPQRLLCCSQSNRGGPAVLHAWNRNDDEPGVHPLLELQFVPVLLSLFQEKIVAVGESSVTLLTWSSTVPLLVGKNLYDDGDDSDEHLALNEEFTCGGIPSGATHVVWSSDGTTVALSSPCGLVLVDCRVRYDVSTSAVPVVLVLDCTCWYGESAVAFAAFGGSSLFALSRSNHLVSLWCGEEWWNDEPFLQRDGHILTRAHQVTCFAVGGSAEGHLVVGLSDGTVKLLLQDTLEVFFVVDVTKNVYRDIDVPQLPPVCGELCVKEVVVGREVMVVMRSDVVVCYNKNSMEMLECNTLLFSGRTLQNCTASKDGCWCAFDLSEQEILYFTATDCSRLAGCDESVDPTGDIIHAQVPLPSRLLEPLHLPLIQQQRKPPSTQQSGKLGGVRDKKALVDKPVTFGHPIKSSGYTAIVPWSVQQREKKQREKAARAPKQQPTSAITPQYTFLPLSTCPLRPMTSANNIIHASPIHRAVVTSAKFTANGSALLTSSGDTSAFMLKIPVAKNNGEGTALRVHTAPLSSIDVNMSLSAPVVATSSTDGVVAVWQPTKRTSPYITQKIGKDARSVRFVYTDQFVCYATANSVNFCRYCLDDGGGDLDRKRNESRIKPVLEFTVPSAQHVVGIDAINYFTSNVVVWAASNKSFGIYDLAVGQNISVIEEAHTRPIHGVALLTAGRYASVGSSQFHMCLTAGADNTVRLWDIRQKHSVRQLAQHRSASMAVGVAFSPSGALVAVGSETRSVFMYDVGSGAVLDRIPASDTPTAICWHPIENVLAIGTSNGGVQLMGQR